MKKKQKPLVKCAVLECHDTKIFAYGICFNHFIDDAYYVKYRNMAIAKIPQDENNADGNMKVPTTGVLTFGVNGITDGTERDFYTERGYSRGGDKSGKRRKAKKKNYKASDFPCYIDGFYFEHYIDWAENEGISGGEIVTYDDLTDRDFAYGWNAKDFAELPWDKTSSTKQLPSYTAPAKTIPKGTYDLYEKLAHMNYVVLRTDKGIYYAVWISLNEGAKLADAMTDVVIGEPAVVYYRDWGRFHHSEDEKTYTWASWHFSAGGESVWRSESRIKEVSKDDYIPKNLKALAYEGRFDELNEEPRPLFDKDGAFLSMSGDNRAVYARYKTLVDAWVKAGCVGWHSGKLWKNKGGKQQKFEF